MNTTELKKLAEAATPGPWHRMANKDFGPISASDDQSFGMFIDCGSAHSDEDARYIAAANPAAILKLLAINAGLVEALRGMLLITNDSQGVLGYHLNGEIAHWGEFPEVAIADAALAKAEGGEL